jgi:hypothetical protein
VRNSLENLVLLGQMRSIRGYYRGLIPEAGEFFDPPEADVLYQAAVETIGLRASPGQALFTGASVVAAINSILGGAGLALLAGRLGHLGDGAALTVGGAAAVLVFGLHLGYQQQRVADLRSPIVSRTGPAPSQRPGAVGPLLAQAAAGPTGRTPHSPTAA